MVKGYVKWFDQKRGYGFITRSDGNDIFVHYKAIQKDGFKILKEGQPVEFDIRDRTKGHPEAVNVRIK
jgi:CspA family cold shock protein